MIIYRFENPETMAGMWYTFEGKLDPFILTLSEGVSAALPMEPHERYGTGGKRWFSGCQSLEFIRHWFSRKDAEELVAAGYRLYEIESEEYMVEDVQTLFTREGIVSMKEIDWEPLWDI